MHAKRNRHHACKKRQAPWMQRETGTMDARSDPEFLLIIAWPPSHFPNLLLHKSSPLSTVTQFKLSRRYSALAQ